MKPMRSISQRLNSMPYWHLAVMVSMVFGAGLFAAFAIEEGPGTAIQFAGPLTVMSLVGFGIVKFTMPHRN